jgi:hypothetical protein
LTLHKKDWLLASKNPHFPKTGFDDIPLNSIISRLIQKLFVCETINFLPDWAHHRGDSVCADDFHWAIGVTMSNEATANAFAKDVHQLLTTESWLSQLQNLLVAKFEVF